MICKLISNYLSEYYDTESVGWRRRLIELHVRRCSTCRSHLKRLDLLSGVYSNAMKTATVPLPNGLTDRVMEHVRLESPLASLEQISDATLLPSFARSASPLRSFMQRPVPLGIALTMLIITVASVALLIQHSSETLQPAPTQFIAERDGQFDGVGLFGENDTNSVFDKQQFFTVLMTSLTGLGSENEADAAQLDHAYLPDVGVYDAVSRLSSEEQVEFNEELLDFVLNNSRG